MVAQKHNQENRGATKTTPTLNKNPTNQQNQLKIEGHHLEAS